MNDNADADDIGEEYQLQGCLELGKTACNHRAFFQVGQDAEERHENIPRDDSDHHPEIEEIERNEGKEDSADQNLVREGIEEAPEGTHRVVAAGVPAVVPVAHGGNHEEQSRDLYPDRIIAQDQNDNERGQQNTDRRDDIWKTDRESHAGAMWLAVCANEANLGIGPEGHLPQPAANQLFTGSGVASGSGNDHDSAHAVTKPHLITLLIFLLGGYAHLTGQSIEEYEEFYYYLRFTPLEQIVFCSQVDSVQGAPICYGIKRGTAGRPIEIARFRLGNIDNSGDYSIIRMKYRSDGSGTVEERTFHLSNGAPVTRGKTSIVEILNRPAVGVTMRSLLDLNREPVDDSVWVARAFITRQSDGTYEEQWFVSNGKQQKGSGSDPIYAQFGPMPPGVWFRRFGLDSAGSLAWERVYGLDLKPIPFSGDAYLRRYERGACDSIVTVSFFDSQERPAVDIAGVHAVTTRHDRRGNIAEVVYRDLAGRLHIPTGGKGARIRFQYRSFDDYLESIWFYDEQDSLITNTPSR